MDNNTQYNGQNNQQYNNQNNQQYNNQNNQQYNNQNNKQNSIDAKTTGWVAYITWIGFIVSMVAGDTQNAKFHLNQAFVIHLAFTVSSILSFIPFIGWILSTICYIFTFICWLLGLIAAVNQEEKEVPLLGKIKILK